MTWVIGPGDDGSVVGLSDLSDLFHPFLFYDSMILHNKLKVISHVF